MTNMSGSVVLHTKWRTQDTSMENYNTNYRVVSVEVWSYTKKITTV